jgi:hypothetical protein
VNDIIQLRVAGAPCVIALHHATKDIREKGLSLEYVLRGTGDIAAHPDTVYGILRDAKLYDNGAGASEIEVVCVKARDFDPPLPFRLAATYKKPGATFPVSYITETGNFAVVNAGDKLKRDAELVIQKITSEPMISFEKIIELTDLKESFIRQTLKAKGWHRAKGGPEGVSPWHQDNERTGCPYDKSNKVAGKPGVTNLNTPPGSTVQ